MICISFRRRQRQDRYRSIADPVSCFQALHPRIERLAFVELQPWQKWLGGVRYDWTQATDGRSGAEWAIEPYVGFILSEFLRFRLAYKHTDRSRRFGSAEIIRSETSFDEVLFQASFVLGAHPRRPY